jgi:hypothetical protein
MTLHADWPRSFRWRKLRVLCFGARRPVEGMAPLTGTKTLAAFWHATALAVFVAVLSSLALVGSAATARADEIVAHSFEDNTWTDGLVDVRSLDLSRTNIGKGFAGNGLQVRIPTGGFRGLGPFDRLEPAPEQVWFRYHIRLLSWNAASTGKLPGLAGIYSSSGRGCIRPTPSLPGWSARGMFGVPGTHGAPAGRVPIGTYLYHVDQAGDCGDELWWPGASLQPGRWYCIEGQVRMNTPGSNDGLVRGWLGGKQMFTKGDVQFRRAGEDTIGVRHMWHDVYFGGSWPTPNPLSLQYDEVAVSTTGRVGCLAPFTDIGSTIHSTAIEELHALGYLYGCGYRKACPTQELTRGEAAAFISRILALPNTSVDYFSDDTGHIFENVINRLAEAGITVGCGSGRFCPERTMSRAEFAVMLVRGLHLRGSAPDAFTDDDGHWAENDINLFAAAGLTHGCGSGHFCPDVPVRRDEAAAFFYRALDLLTPIPQASAGPSADFPPPGEPPAIPPEETD